MMDLVQVQWDSPMIEDQPIEREMIHPSSNFAAGFHEH
jgi:hypothetical protein